MNFAWASLVWVMVTDLYVRFVRLRGGDGRPEFSRSELQVPRETPARFRAGTASAPDGGGRSASSSSRRAVVSASGRSRIPCSAPFVRNARTGCVRWRPPPCPRCGAGSWPPSTAPGLCGECRVRRRPFRMAVAAAPYEGGVPARPARVQVPAAGGACRTPGGPRHRGLPPRAPGTTAPAPRERSPPRWQQVPVPFWRGRRRGFKPGRAPGPADRPGNSGFRWFAACCAGGPGHRRRL